jgi:hypothetical protein
MVERLLDAGGVEAGASEPALSARASMLAAGGGGGGKHGFQRDAGGRDDGLLDGAQVLRVQGTAGVP